MFFRSLARFLPTSPVQSWPEHLRWGDLLLFAVWTAVISLMIVVGVVLRIWRRHLGVPLWKASVPTGLQLVGEFVESCYDGNFGFPSGRFVVEWVEADRLVARELVGTSSHFINILAGLYRAVLSVGGNCGCLGMTVTFLVALWATPVLLYVALVEWTLRYLLRSQIVAEVSPIHGGCFVRFRLRGPCALLVGRRLQRAFHQPELPSRIHSLAGASV